jgi:hypothetical protein
MRKSNQDREIRDDFYEAKIRIIILGKKDTAESIGDNWAVPELAYAKESGRQCFIYAGKDVDKKEIKELELPFEVIVVNDENAFVMDVEKRLKEMMSP